MYICIYVHFHIEVKSQSISGAHTCTVLSIPVNLVRKE